MLLDVAEDRGVKRLVGRLAAGGLPEALLGHLLDHLLTSQRFLGLLQNFERCGHLAELLGRLFCGRPRLGLAFGRFRRRLGGLLRGLGRAFFRSHLGSLSLGLVLPAWRPSPRGSTVTTSSAGEHPAWVGQVQRIPPKGIPRPGSPLPCP